MLSVPFEPITPSMGIFTDVLLEWEIRPIGFHQPNYRHTFIHFLKMALNPFRAHQSICKKYSWMPSLECDKGQMGLIKVSTRFFFTQYPEKCF